VESALTNACILKIENFEGPLDLLYHLIEKNKIDIYDIPIGEITDQYMDYLFAMRQLDLEIASEFLVMAATLLQIKSKTLLPQKKQENEEEGEDPREELVSKLVEYKKFKEFSDILKQREEVWDKVYYKLPEAIEFEWETEILELSPEELKKTYADIIRRNNRKLNKNTNNMTQILEREKVTIKSKMMEIARYLVKWGYVKFNEVFSIKKRSRTEVVTAFQAALELSKANKVRLKQKRLFSDIYILKNKRVE